MAKYSDLEKKLLEGVPPGGCCAAEDAAIQEYLKYALPSLLHAYERETEVDMDVPNEAVGQAGDFSENAIVVAKKWLDEKVEAVKKKKKAFWE